ncbi:conserved hypothetical protein [Ruegeria lacuscaerulensis ITI-1157]|nr:conserved hypothetical protein [Ruegeria lacuscaerulensis ITI-1157]
MRRPIQTRPSECNLFRTFHACAPNLPQGLTRLVLGRNGKPANQAIPWPKKDAWQRGDSSYSTQTRNSAQTKGTDAKCPVSIIGHARKASLIRATRNEAARTGTEVLVCGNGASSPGAVPDGRPLRSRDRRMARTAFFLPIFPSSPPRPAMYRTRASANSQPVAVGLARMPDD